MAYNTPTSNNNSTGNSPVSYNGSTGNSVRVISPANTVQGTNSNYITSKTYRGFSSNNPNAINGVLYDADIIKQDIYNHFMTRRGERVMMPKFGSIIWEYLYEPLDETTKEIIEQDARDIIGQDPRATLYDLNVSSFEQGIVLNITIMLNPQNVLEQMAIEFNVNGIMNSAGGGY